ncbi:MAG: serine protease [Methanothrix sp.]|nr:MAG: serine protease [Methanothrix sp.]
MSEIGPLTDIAVKICRDKNPESAIGSGFFISPIKIATCHHVLSTEKKIGGQFWCQRYGSQYWIRATPIYQECDEMMDKALLSVTDNHFDFLNDWDGQSKDFVSIGFDSKIDRYGMEFSTVKGKISGCCSCSCKNRLQLSVIEGAIQKGRSGSPVWSVDQNSIVGMIAKVFPEAKGFDAVTAISISDIISDLEREDKSSYYYHAIEGPSQSGQGKPSKRDISPIDIQVFRDSIESDLDEFYSTHDKNNPFQRLAWLILEHETILGESIIGPTLNEIISISDADAIFKNCVQMLYDYQELQIEHRFPDSIVEKLDKNFCNMVLDIDEWSYSNNRRIFIDEMKKWLRFSKSGIPAMQTSNSLAYALNKFHKARKELEDPSIDTESIAEKVRSAFARSERLLQHLLSFYEYSIYGKNLETEKDKNFIYYVQQLNRLDQAIAIACKCSEPKDANQAQESNFGSVFKRQRLFQNQMETNGVMETVREGNQIMVPVKEGNQINLKKLDIKEQSMFIKSLNEIIKLKELYEYENCSRDFLHPNNFDNVVDGAIKILVSFIELWESSEKNIFPKVVFILRIMQVDLNRIRLDYTSTSKSSSERIWIEAKSLPAYTIQLLGKEVYLWILHEDAGIVSKLLLYPVDEEMWEAIK